MSIYPEAVSIGDLMQKGQNILQGQQATQMNALKLDQQQMQNEAMRQQTDAMSALRNKPMEQWTADDYMRAGMPEKGVEKIRNDIDRGTEMLSTVARVVRENVLPHADNPAKFAESIKTAKDTVLRLYPESAAAIDKLPANPSKDEIMAFLSAAEHGVKTKPDIRDEWGDMPDGKTQQYYLIVNGVAQPVPGVTRAKEASMQIVTTADGIMAVDKNKLRPGEVFAKRPPSGGEGASVARDRLTHDMSEDEKRRTEKQAERDAKQAELDAKILAARDMIRAAGGQERAARKAKDNRELADALTLYRQKTSEEQNGGYGGKKSAQQQAIDYLNGADTQAEFNRRVKVLKGKGWTDDQLRKLGK